MYVQNRVRYAAERAELQRSHIGLHAEQVWNEDNADEEVVAMVVRPGLHTTMGEMLRHVFAPVSEMTATDPFFKVCLF